MIDPRIRLYGPSRGEGSFAQVTRGMRRALAQMTELAGFCALDVEDEEFGCEVGDMSAPVSLNIGTPQGLLEAHRCGAHKSHWLLLAPNGEVLPRGFMESLVAPSEVLPRGMLTGGLLTPSAWGAGVLRRYLPALPVVVCPHGVTQEVHKTDPALREATRKAYAGGAFDVLHMTSSETERKSTRALLRAWKDAKRVGAIPVTSRLQVTMNPTQMNRLKWWNADLGLGDEDVVVHPGLAYKQGNIAALYGNMHVVCQPSRGEGFGLVPCESLACGTPIVATKCTGHSEWFTDGLPGAVAVKHGAVAPMDDFPGSMAPSVDWVDIRNGLAEAYATWPRLADAAEQNADSFRAEWAWENKVPPGIRRMLNEVGDTNVRTSYR